MPDGLLGANPNIRSAPEGSLTRGLAPQGQGLGTTEPQHRIHPAAPPPPGLRGAPLVIQGGRTGRALGTPVTFKGPRAKARGPTLPLASALTSAHPSACLTDGGSGLLVSWELALTLGPPLRGPSQGAWHCNARDWGPRSPAPDSTCHSATTRAAKGAAGHSGWENSQGLPSPLWPSKALHAKTPGPMLPLASALTSALPSAHCLGDGNFCRPPGG